MPDSQTASTLPGREFRAGMTFIRWPGLLVLLNIAIVIIALIVHQIPLISLFGTMGFAFLIVLVSAATLRVTLNEDGLTQRWIWGKRRISWNEIASIERIKRGLLGDGLFLLDEKDKEIFAVSSLNLPDQELITAEAIKYARLRRDKKPLKRGITARWIRK
jgi:hypothetical protein